MIKVATLSEVPNFGKKTVTVDGKNIVLANNKGAIYAFESECPHQGAPMATAIVKDEYVSCPRHGYRFSLADGTCKEHPDFTLRTYRVELSGDDILIDMG